MKRIVALTAADFRGKNSGGSLRDFNLVSALTRVASVDIFTFPAPYPGTGAPIDATVHLAARRPTATAAVRSVWRRRPYLAEAMDYSAHTELRGALQRADLIYASMIYAAAYSARWKAQERSHKPLVWDTQNFDLEVWETRAEVWRGPRKQLALLQGRYTRALFDLAVSRADTIIACTGRDAELYKAQGAGSVCIVENAADVEFFLQLPDIRDDRTIGLFGSLGQDATAAGAVWFLREVWPRVRSQGGGHLRLRIGGRGPRSDVVAAARQPGVELVPDPPAIGGLMAACHVIVVPQPYGTGSKVKVYEALASGAHVVASPPAAQGMAPEVAKRLVIAEAPEEWEQEIRRALKSPLWPRDLSFLRSISWDASEADLLRAIERWT